MKLTKYQHACFSVEKNDRSIVIDPGSFSEDFISPDNVAAVVITHQHPDHLDHERLAEIFSKNNDVIIIGPNDVIATIEVENVQPVQAGDKITIAGFDLQFFGGTHALIHPSLPAVESIGVLINELIYYPGDSLVAPGVPVDTLALPAAAPWLKVGETLDFLSEVKPRLAFPTHDAILSGSGQSLIDRLIGQFAATQAIDYQRLDSVIEL